MSKSTRRITGPQGLILTLDASEIFPDDPGNGTPAMLDCGEYSGTFWCAADTGELSCGEYELTSAQRRWINEVAFPLVDVFMDTNTRRGE